MSHETDYQRARRQRSEVKKHGITGSTPSDALKRIKAHSKSKALSKVSIERKNKNFGYTISDHKGRILKKGEYND